MRLVKVRSHNMCKHILINNFTSSDLAALKLFTDKTSDRDGFGAIIRTKSNDILTLKSLNQSDFYLKLGMELVANDVKDLVVHHRTSTNGQGLDYAHPFEFRGNYLTHNGVVSVPDKHETKTTNDSEVLLHHLIKTNYQTETVSGYFSCFILNTTETIVLVDDKAPIYSDGRIYSSHKLGEGFQSVRLKKIVIGLDGSTLTTDIKVVESDYGRDKAHLSLGSSNRWSITSYEDSYYPDRSYYYDSQVDVFLRYVTPDDEYLIATQRKRKQKYRTIKALAESFGLVLSKDDYAELLEYFEDSYYRIA